MNQYLNRYRWLRDLSPLPRMVAEGIALLGTKEVVGRGSNRTIISWSTELQEAFVRISGFSDDDIPWCGLFVAILAFRRRGLATEVVADPLWARNWARYGQKSPQASLGDVLVFQRPTGGHVGIYIAEDPQCYHVLGGNQSNAVTITRIMKSRCIAVRRPIYLSTPSTVKPYHVAPSGGISRNEA